MTNSHINTLLIEDNPLHAKIVTRMMDKLASIDVESSNRLSDGLARLAQGGIDIVLLDLRLPDSKGRETFKRIQTMVPDVPVVILSGNEDEELAVQLIHEGAQDYMTKGKINKSMLSRSMQYAIERKKIELKLIETTRKLGNTAVQLEDAIETANQMAVKAEVISAEFNQIFNTSADGMWVIDTDYNILRANDASAKIVEQNKNEIIGKKCFDVFSSKNCKSPNCPMNMLGKNNERFECDAEREFQDGTISSFIITAAPLRVLDGQRVGIIVNLTDITARKKAEDGLQKANKKLKRLAVVDSLTKIANRRKFDARINLEWKRLAREKSKLALIICDIDYFKLYNDTYGHQAGDDCLIAVARKIKKTVKRPADLVARYGGEEFAVILPNTHAKGAMYIAEAIRTAVKNLKIPHSDSSADRYVTLSLGVSSIVPADNIPLASLIERADRALYQAKEQGRNQSIVKSLAP